MHKTVLAALGGLGLLLAATSATQAATYILIDCPAEARSAVTYTGDPGWTATNQGSRVVGVRIETIGSQPALVCTYRMFGTEYWIYRRIDPVYPFCRPADRFGAFYCATAP